MRIVFMGTPGFAIPVLEQLLRSGHPVVGVYTQPDRPAGRGRGLTAPAVKVYAQQKRLPVFQPASFRRTEAVEQLAALRPDGVVVAAYGRLLPGEVLQVAPKGTLNLHPSLLPRYRGPSPVIAALLDGVETTGVTVFLVDEGMDSGPIVGQREVPVLPGDTAGVLTERLFREGAALLLELLPVWEAGWLRPVPQDEAGATVTRRYAKEDGELDWSLPAALLARRLRAFWPWPGCFTWWRGKRLEVLGGASLEGAGDRAASRGEVVVLADGALAVGTGKGLLRVDRLQLEGRKPQAAEEFLRGYPGFVGSRVPSR
ncbi:MAG: methionyl-tRNA formyltransferase [Chloroflexi bacterium]|nr:methionyl-tRNA formyltransferase [Chloroflexota bacterium]